jgi:biotin synthase-like enzyme
MKKMMKLMKIIKDVDHVRLKTACNVGPMTITTVNDVKVATMPIRTV